jgi:hypothetical protein
MHSVLQFWNGVTVGRLADVARSWRKARFLLLRCVTEKCAYCMSSPGRPRICELGFIRARHRQVRSGPSICSRGQLQSGRPACFCRFPGCSGALRKSVGIRLFMAGLAMARSCRIEYSSSVCGPLHVLRIALMSQTTKPRFQSSSTPMDDWDSWWCYGRRGLCDRAEAMEPSFCGSITA